MAQLVDAHLICIPFPLYGHITPMLQLCRILASWGASITLIITETNHSKVAHHLRHNPCPSIHLLSVPQSLPPDFHLNLSTFRQYLESCENLRGVLEPLLERLATNLLQRSPPRALYIFSDVYLAWTQDFANKLHLPRIALWTSNAAECQVYFHASKLLSQGYLPFTDATRNIDVSIPGLPPLKPQDFPSFLQLEDTNDILFSFFIKHAARMHEADMVLINTFEELERSTFDALRDGGVKVFPVGPLFLLQEEEAKEGRDTPEDGKQEDEEVVFQWLDTQLPNSVLFIAFGSVSPFTHATVLSIARTLERMGRPFLWALRPGCVAEVWDPLPEGFMERTKGRGMVVEWVKQRRVLKHPSVGVCLTHCGWNSTIESIAMEVPMLFCPIGGDQTLTAKMAADVWKVGLRFSEEDMEKLVREMMCGEMGKEMRERISKLGHAARKVVEEGGSSSETFMRHPLFLASSD